MALTKTSCSILRQEVASPFPVKMIPKMDEHIRVDNNFCLRREETQRYSEMTRDFKGRFHPKHIQSIHNPSQNEEMFFGPSARGHRLFHGLSLL
jgi:hypothetical protein